MFPVTQIPESATPQQSNTSKRRTEPAKPTRRRSSNSEDFGDDGLDDEDLVKATSGDLGFDDIDNFTNPMDAITRNNTIKNKTATKSKGHTKAANNGTGEDDQGPIQLSNGKWACNHVCKDKNACKHLCCKEGMDNPPKKPASVKRIALHEDKSKPAPSSSQTPKVTQSKLQLTASKRKISSTVEELDLTQEETRKKKTDYIKNGPRDYRELHQLHKTIQKKDPPSTLHSVMHTKPTYCYSEGGEHTLSFLQEPKADVSEDWSDYGDLPFDELSSQFDTPQASMHRDLPRQKDIKDADNSMEYLATAPVASRESDTFEDHDSLLGDAMVGLADSQNLRALHDDNDDNRAYRAANVPDIEFDTGFQDDDFPMEADPAVDDYNDWPAHEDAPHTRSVHTRNVAPNYHHHAPFSDSTSSPRQPKQDIRSAKTPLPGSRLQEHETPKPSSSASRQDPTNKSILDDTEMLDLTDMFEDQPIEQKPVPEAYKELEPWLFQEFGDILELVDP
jgi:ATP-dependent DNA helicase HFM1/MER3